MSTFKQLSEDNYSPFRQERPLYSIIPLLCMFLASSRNEKDSHHKLEVGSSPSRYGLEIGDFCQGLEIKSSPFRHERLPHSITSNFSS